MIKHWKKSLLVQIVGSFSVLSFGIIFLVGCITYIQARQSLKQSVFDRLTTVASLKEGELHRWVIDRRDVLFSLTQISEIQTAVQVLLIEDKFSYNYQYSLETLETLFGDFIRNRSDYREIFIISSGGRILMSTNPEKIGQYLPRDQTSETFQTADNITFFISNFYQSSDTNLPTVTLSTPIFDRQNNRLGTLAAHINLDRVDEIIGENQGMGVTGKSYLVTDVGNSFAARYVFVSAEGFVADQFPDGLDSPAIAAAMTGSNGRGLYPNYQGVPVIGVYRWLKGEDVALLVEMEQAEAFALANRLARSVFLTGLVLAGIMALGILLLARRIVTPILAIAKAARSVQMKVKAGNFSALETAPVQSENEIGTLAHTFNQMTEQLHDSYQELQIKNQELQSAFSELTQTQLQLIQNEKMASLGQMVAGIAHEINNPVSFIYGNLSHLQEYTDNLMEFLQLYQDRYPDSEPEFQAEAEELDIEFIQEDLPEIVNSMRVGTERIRQIILSLRNFSRLDEAEVKAVNIHEGIDSTLLILQHKLKKTSQHPEIQVIRDYGDLPLVKCYPSQLNQVFMNILANAIDALEERDQKRTEQEIQENPSQITIRTSTADENWVEIEISDNGIGMPESVRQKIFDPFFTTKSIGKGTGMGMPISHQIITERHAGKLNCFSQPGEGTTFTILIPIVQVRASLDE